MTWLNQPAWERPFINKTDLLNGTHLISYIPVVSSGIAGGGVSATVEILTTFWNGVRGHVPGSPFNVWLSEDRPLDPSRSTTQNVPTHITAGVVSQFTIFPKDTNGNTMTDGIQKFLITLMQPNGVPTGTAAVNYLFDSDGGRYLVEFMSTTATSTVPHQLEVQHILDAQARNLAGSPFSLYVAPGELYPANC